MAAIWWNCRQNIAIKQNLQKKEEVHLKILASLLKAAYCDFKHSVQMNIFLVCNVLD
jgi:hypothetical protein